MSFIAQPVANLHSPGAIGDVTPGTGAFTTVTATTAFSSQDGAASISDALGLAGAGSIYYGGGDGKWKFLGASGASVFLALGDVTTSFPAIKRNATGIDFRLADDSNYAPCRASTFTGDGSALTALTPQNITGATLSGINFLGINTANAISFPRINANNTVDVLTVSDYLIAIGATLAAIESAASIVPIADGTYTIPGTLSNGSITFVKGICTAYTPPSFL